MSFWHDKNRLLTRSAGLLGFAVAVHLRQVGVSDDQITIPHIQTCNFWIWKDCVAAVAIKDIFIHRAAKVEGTLVNKQYGFNSTYRLPVNFYGPPDNFNPGSSQVFPAGIKKFVEVGLKAVIELYIRNMVNIGGSVDGHC